MFNTVQSFDELVSGFFREYICNPVLDVIMTVFTFSGEAGAVWIILGLILVFIPKYRKAGISMLAGLVVMLLINNITLKSLFSRPRPFIDNESISLIIAAPSGFSFPSGHASASFAGAFGLTRAKKVFAAWAFPLAAVISISRVYLQVHYLSDVVAGMLLGILYGAIGALITDEIFKLAEKKKKA